VNIRLLDNVDDDNQTESLRQVQQFSKLFKDMTNSASYAEMLCILYCYLHFRARLIYHSDPDDQLSDETIVCIYFATIGIFIQVTPQNQSKHYYMQQLFFVHHDNLTLFDFTTIKRENKIDCNISLLRRWSHWQWNFLLDSHQQQQQFKELGYFSFTLVLSACWCPPPVKTFFLRLLKKHAKKKNC
jgi:hypothetical protein